MLVFQEFWVVPEHPNQFGLIWGWQFGFFPDLYRKVVTHPIKLMILDSAGNQLIWRNPTNSFKRTWGISSQGPYAVTVNWNNSLNNILCHYCGKKILNYHHLKILLILNWWTRLHSFVILYDSKAERSLENLMNYYCLFWYYSNSSPWRSEVRNSVCLSVSTTIRLIRINFRRRNFEKTNQHRICGHKPT